MRFVAIILDPTWSLPRHGVVDLHRKTLVCECKCERDADEIAACMNQQFIQKAAHLLADVIDRTNL